MPFQPLTFCGALWHSSGMLPGQGRLPRAFFRAPRLVVLAVLGAAAVSSASCGNIDLGDNFLPPTIELDEDFFYCRIQPEVLTMYRCGPGDPAMGDMASGCHEARTGFRLSMAADTDPRPTCVDGLADPATVSDAYRANFDAVRPFVGGDPQSSPVYQRPLQIAAHPRRIFLNGEPPALLIEEWLRGGAR